MLVLNIKKMNQNINLFITIIIFTYIIIMSQNIETINELDNCVDCEFFTFNGEIHLAKVVKCYDGDTIHCIFKYNGEYKKFIIRMYGYDSWEIKPSKQIPEPDRTNLKIKAINAKKRLEDLILNKNIYLYCKEFDKYGRLLANIKINIKDKKTINDIMVEEGHGYLYYGGTKKKTDAQSLEE